MTKFVVLLNPGGNQATIALEGYSPTDGSFEIGTFDMNIDPINARVLDPSEMAGGQHEHPYIAKAKEILADSDQFRGEVNSLTFLDKASNAAVHPETMLSTDDNELQPDEERTDGGDTPAGGEGAEHEPKTGENTGDGGNDDEDAEHEGETIDQLKERLKGVTDKSALEADYKAEQEGKNRAGAIAAYEARAAELDTPAA